MNERDEGLYYDHDSYGEGYDCETCGWNYDDIDVTEYGPEDGGDWEVRVSSGCYGGWNEFFPTPQKAVEYLRTFDDHLPKRRAAFTRMADRLDSYLKKEAA